MGLKDRIARWALKTLDVDDELLFPSWDQATWSTNNFYALSREGYEHCSTVFRCINLVTKSAANVMFGVFQENEEGPELVPNHLFLRKLKRPNPIMSRASFIKNTLSSLLLGGRAFIWANVVGDNEVEELWPIPPADMQINFGRTFGEILNYNWSYEGVVKQLPAEQVLYLWFPNPRDPMRHVSPLKAAAQEVDFTNQGLSWNLSLLRNSAKPPFFVSMAKDVDMSLTDQQVNEIKHSLRTEYSGYGETGKAPVFKVPGLQLTPYGWNPQDMDWLKGIETADIRIANVYDVPPELVGAQKKYENFEVAQRALYTDAVLPLMEYLAEELTNWDVLGFMEDERLGLLRDKVKQLQDEQKDVAKWTGGLVDRGILTRNEARKELRYPISEDPMADALTVSKEVYPLSVTGAESIGIEEEEV